MGDQAPVKRSQSAPWILTAGLGALLLVGVVGRVPGGPSETAVLPDGPPPRFPTRAAEALVAERAPDLGLVAALPAPDPLDVRSDAVVLEVIALLPDGLATPPVELEHLWLPPGEPPTDAFAAAAEGDPQSWARARSSTFGSAVFVLEDLEPGTHLFRLRGRGSSVETFGPFELRTGQRETLEAALWPGGALELELVDASGRRLAADEVEGWSAEAYRGDHRYASPRAPRRGELVGERFEFTRLNEGWQTIVLRDPSGAEFELPPAEVELFGAPTRVSFTLEPAGSSTGPGAGSMELPPADSASKAASAMGSAGTSSMDAR
jgi:hypothetical protein